MRIHPLLTTSAFGLSLLCTQSHSAKAAFSNHVRSKTRLHPMVAFTPRYPSSSSSTSTSSALKSTSASSSVSDVPTSPIEGMKPGTSGLRKKVEVWQAVEDVNKNYVENFIQSLIDTAKDSNDGNMIDTVIVAGDGRYYNNEAIQIICRVLAGNGVSNIWIPQNGIMSTPAVSAAIRRREGGKAKGGIVLTASHNPGGPGEDFGIKYNEAFGQPAGEEFTDALYEKTLSISSFKTIQDSPDIDLSADAGATYQLTPTTTVTIIDPFDNYLDALKSCFDFAKLKEFCAREDFSILFDGMHGAGGPFARRVLIEELGLPESSLLRCDPRPDFGKCHPDPNLTYAASLIKKMGLNPDGSADTSADIASLPTLGAANDGDGDRNLIAGAGCFVTPSDSLALICDNWESIPHFANEGGPRGVARSMPSSAALDVVAEARGIPCFSTPTGWKFFGNLMSSKEMFGKTDYTPFLCGEESFGTGSDHIREKDGLWAVLSWMSILMKANEDTPAGEPLVGVKDIVTKHWAKYGRHFYCRYDYEAVDSDAANKVMDLVRDEFVNGDVSSVPDDDSGITLTGATEFAYTDPVDGSQTSKQGLILNFEYPNGDPSRVVFRLSGTGSAGATIRMYLERYEKDESKHGEAAPQALKSLAQRALSLVKMEEITGREGPTVIT
uniref:phosphoglucomutase (alpha-D-glucose-1,6-bisphosphate-dependent) n=1 Tax=Helicotheca tamesis TaxID=374047 RepID=A0A7S2HMG2_9STRA|mmetsp:Transcript_19421/g.26656  ORF Transcript_19421/g.26656 Transcript_19421/m.26656 type:complete len:667 (+) Transcript_19421:138-2138(+)|eukprot:CAMPEP_0185733636 /NCGR_PEP_ID=MMETSP1171-20130828/20175_1 /TAXON_ID=374046 /ORGANISM="Helicotheca tamensis, Strain CCMP826" /LENGTH=666 /DNA_ID=CAMNT_0028403415 /DNA_START=60 /DNA_END=2060 /DNA_ORIENTATION=+